MPKGPMTGKAAVVAAFALSAAAVAGWLLARPSAAAHGKYTVAFVSAVTGTADPRIQELARGGRLAARKLGDRFILAGPRYSGPGDAVALAFQSMIARHVDAIATDGFEPLLTPILAQVRAAGIKLIASGDDIAAKRSLWVSQSDIVAYSQALADSLASQMNARGEYAIARQPGQFPIANESERLIEAYVAKVYPNMHFEGFLDGSDVNGIPRFGFVEKYVTAHPHLKGLIALVPRCTYSVAEAIIHAHEVGKVFSADNGGGSFGGPLPGYVRSGAAQIVFPGDFFKLGYLTVWGAHYLLTGHHFRPGAYQVGGRVGLVWYYAKHRELRLGDPLTITKTNVGIYANKF
jgi:ABC-type sugar transport system substrate-binding protein